MELRKTCGDGHPWAEAWVPPSQEKGMLVMRVGRSRQWNNLAKSAADRSSTRIQGVAGRTGVVNRHVGVSGA